MGITRERVHKWSYSLKIRLMGIILLCGIVPVVFMAIFVTASYRGEIIEKTETMIENEMHCVASVMSARLSSAIRFCRTPICDAQCEEWWIDQRNGEEAENERLKRLFEANQRFDLFVFYKWDEEQPLCYSEKNGYSYDRYVEEIQPIVNDQRMEKQGDTKLFLANGRIFILQDVYELSEHQKYGVLVVEMNQEKLFQDIDPQIVKEMEIYLNDSNDRLILNKRKDHHSHDAVEEALFRQYNEEKTQRQVSVRNFIHSGYLLQFETEYYDLGIIYVVENKEIYSEIYGFYKVMLLLVIIMILFFRYMMHFLKSNISEPIRKVVAASKMIESGAIGTTLPDEKMPNIEFEHLKEAYNKMSRQVKSLYEYAYDEKMAKKDAKIMALQAQINPHFLNNTLEMMNWQSKLSGDMTISSMIEALGIVLNSNMNRELRKLTTLAEELKCADAYFYIVSKRFGQYFTVEKEIDERALEVKVPHLVLQPIVENAVIHGVERDRQGVIKIQAHCDEKNIYLQVRNTGKSLTKEEIEKIDELLHQKLEVAENMVKSSSSLAIRNINERIKLIYGEEYGLEIHQEQEYTITTIVMPLCIEEEEIEAKTREKVRQHMERF